MQKTESKTATTTDSATQKYAASVVENCRARAALSDAKRITALIKRYSAGVLTLRLKVEDFNACGGVALMAREGVESVRVSKTSERVSVGVKPLALFAAVAKTRGEGNINAREAFKLVLDDLRGNAGALAEFHAETARAAERTPSAVFVEL